jgi:hypothetical protein
LDIWVNMDHYDIKRLALLAALQTEVEAMKAANEERKQKGESLAYVEADFAYLASQINTLAYKHNEQL